MLSPFYVLLSLLGIKLSQLIDADQLSEVISVVLTAVHTQLAASAPCVFVAWWLMNHEEKGDPT